MTDSIRHGGFVAGLVPLLHHAFLVFHRFFRGKYVKWGGGLNIKSRSGRQDKVKEKI